MIRPALAVAIFCTCLVSQMPGGRSAELGMAVVLEGRYRVVDGDTISLAGLRIRLHAIDAPELRQSCGGSQGEPTPCGMQAAAALAGFIEPGPIMCRPRNLDRYGRIVAICYAGVVDVGREMVLMGWARAYAAFDRRYVVEETEARAARRGLWRGPWDSPADWRRTRRR